MEARDIADTARREAEQLLAASHADVAVSEPELKPETETELQPEPAADAQPLAEVEAPAPEAESAQEPGPAGGFTLPPSSLEDLAAASRPKRFSIRNQ